jgi:hypothetical protein
VASTRRRTTLAVVNDQPIHTAAYARPHIPTYMHIHTRQCVPVKLAVAVGLLPLPHESVVLVHGALQQRPCLLLVAFL